jgi:hypothetical protein
LAGVSSTAADAATAFGLIALASGPTWSGEVAPASAATAPFRGRHLGAASGWAGGQLTAAEASSYAAAVADSLSAPRALAAVRIPGYPRYLAALDEAVRQAAGGQITPQVALEQAADRWRAITAELGLDAQRAAYQRSLGLAPR